MREKQYTSLYSYRRPIDIPAMDLLTAVHNYDAVSTSSTFNLSTYERLSYEQNVSSMPGSRWRWCSKESCGGNNLHPYFLNVQQKATYLYRPPSLIILRSSNPCLRNPDFWNLKKYSSLHSLLPSHQAYKWSCSFGLSKRKQTASTVIHPLQPAIEVGFRSFPRSSTPV